MASQILGKYSEATLTDPEILWIMLNLNTLYVAINLYEAGTDGVAKYRNIAVNYLNNLRLRQEYRQKGLTYCCGLTPKKPEDPEDIEELQELRGDG